MESCAAVMFSELNHLRQQYTIVLLVLFTSLYCIKSLYHTVQYSALCLTALLLVPAATDRWQQRSPASSGLYSKAHSSDFLSFSFSLLYSFIVLLPFSFSPTTSFIDSPLHSARSLNNREINCNNSEVQFLFS